MPLLQRCLYRKGHRLLLKDQNLAKWRASKIYINCSALWFDLIISATCNVITNTMWKMCAPLFQKPNGDAHRLRERSEQVWHTVELLPRLSLNFFFFSPQTEKSAKVAAWAWLYSLPALDARIPYVVFLTCQRRSWIHTKETKQGVPSHLACIRHAVCEKRDVKRWSTAWVNVTRPYLLDTKIHFVQRNYLPSPPICKCKYEWGEEEIKISVDTCFYGYFTIWTAAIYLLGVSRCQWNPAGTPPWTQSRANVSSSKRSDTLLTWAAFGPSAYIRFSESDPCLCKPQQRATFDLAKTHGHSRMKDTQSGARPVMFGNSTAEAYWQ